MGLFKCDVFNRGRLNSTQKSLILEFIENESVTSLDDQQRVLLPLRLVIAIVPVTKVVSGGR